MFKKEFLLKNEMKHLSKAYRTNYYRMDEPLYDEFYEVGASGNTYNKDAILKAMPLEVFIFEIKSFSFYVEGDYINTNYTLIKDHAEKVYVTLNG